MVNKQLMVEQVCPQLESQVPTANWVCTIQFTNIKSEFIIFVNKVCPFLRQKSSNIRLCDGQFPGDM